ncbi:hypothetical protein BRD16_08225 [Halobacteriales archaeon SW_6_65_46]|nr:MAG: hypothetical protein BRD16_08225 [Halobacteriales archaeon SW_6_65_46]
MSGDSNETARTGGQTRLRRWLLLDGNRWTVAGLLAGCLFSFLVVVGTLDPSPLRVVMTGSDPVETVFEGLVTGIITGVTLVVTIDQLVLSQQLATLDDHRSRLDDSLDFRRDVESLLGDVSPAEPAQFLRALLRETDARAQTLRETVTEGVAGERVAQFTREHDANADTVTARLDGTRYLEFSALRAALDYNYAYRVHQARRLRRNHDDALTDDGADALTAFIDALTLFGPAREYVRGLYFQNELVRLSRVILSAAVPALGVTVAVLLFIDTGDVPGATLGVSNLLLVVSGAVTLAVLPFLLLVSYVFRIVTITQRTLTTGPFILREGDDPEA